MASRTRHALWLPLLAPLVACGGAPPADEAADAQRATASFALPKQGGDDSFDVGNWNLNWFATANIGADDDELQFANVREVIRQADLDVWGLSELVDRADLDRLVDELPGYDALMATDPGVEGSADFDAGQKLGLLYKRDVVTVERARLLFTARADVFGQRPPLETSLRVTVGGKSIAVTLVNVHLKANTGPAQAMWAQRKESAELLKTYLDDEHANDVVLVIGDFNDDIDQSISKGNPSPFAAFVDDAAGYRFLTAPLSAAHQPSSAHFPEFLDHQLASDEASAMALSGTTRVLRLDSVVPGYADTTSDHFPVLSRFALGGAPPPPPPPPPSGARVVINEVLANEPGSLLSGEFVELVNAGTGEADLGGWTLSDAAATRHAFAPGTTLPAGARLVVFGGADGIPPGVVNVFVANDGSLGLNNGGDTVTLRDPAGATVDEVSFGASLGNRDGVSMNRTPDADPEGSFVLHTGLSAEKASPGAEP